MTAAPRYTKVVGRVSRPLSGTTPAPATCPANSGGAHASARDLGNTGRQRCECGAWRSVATWRDVFRDTRIVEISEWTARESGKAHGLVTITLAREPGAQVAQ